MGELVIGAGIVLFALACFWYVGVKIKEVWDMLEKIEQEYKENNE